MSKIKVSKYDQKDQELWDNFVQNSINGTIFHEQRFISYHGNKFEDCSLLIHNNSELIAVFPAAIINKNGKTILKSHPGTSYGGLVFNATIQLKIVFDIINEIEIFAKNNEFDAIEFRHSPNIFRKTPLDQLDFALTSKAYNKIDEELSTCYELSRYKDLEISDAIKLFKNSGRSKARKNINKAFRDGLTFRELDKSEYGLFHNILINNLKKHNAKPVHSLKDINTLKELYPERVRIFGVFKDSELAAAYLIFNVNSIGNHIFYGSIDYNYQVYRPTSFGLFMLIKTFADEGDKFLNMGISTEDGGKVINWDLFAFKESFNGTGILRYYWQKYL